MEHNIDLNMDLLDDLIHDRRAEIERIVEGTGYLPRTVMGVGTFLLDNDGDLDLLTSKQQVTFERFIQPLR